MRPIPITLTLTLLFSTHLPAQTPSFTGLGDLPGGEDYSFGRGVSPARALTAVGSSQSAQSVGTGVPVRWTAQQGLQPITGPDGESLSGFAADVSDDGRMIAGFAVSSRGAEAFTWSLERGYVGLGLVDGFQVTGAYGISGDGRVVVGYAADGSSNIEAVRWTADLGWQRLGKMGGVQSIAHDTSTDRSVIVGISHTGARGEASRWTETLGMQRLEDQFASTAEAVSADGRVIAGTVHVHGVPVEENRGVLWLEDGSTVALGFLPGQPRETYPKALSGDGSIVVGTARVRLGLTYHDHAFIWDTDHGIRDLNDVVVSDYGLDLTGWTLEGALDISPDGTAIVGYGLNPAGRTEAWLAILPEPTTLPTLAAASTLLTLRRRHTRKHRTDAPAADSSNNSRTHY